MDLLVVLLHWSQATGLNSSDAGVTWNRDDFDEIHINWVNVLHFAVRLLFFFILSLCAIFIRMSHHPDETDRTGWIVVAFSMGISLRDLQFESNFIWRFVIIVVAVAVVHFGLSLVRNQKTGLGHM